MSTNDSAQWLAEIYFTGPGLFDLQSSARASFLLPYTPSASIVLRNPVLRDPEVKDNLPEGWMRQFATATFEATQPDATRVAESVAANLADLLAFLLEGPVEVEVHSVRSPPHPSVGDPYTTLARGRLARGYHRAPPADLRIYASTADGYARLPTPDRERVSRALRWLRRSYSEADPFFAFSCLAFSAEAVAPLLPPGSGKNGSSTSARLQAAALVTGVSETAWRTAGRLRHALFHGGISEDEDNRAHVAFACRWVLFLVQSILKDRLGIDGTEPPYPETPSGTPFAATMIATETFLSASSGGVGVGASAVSA